MHCNCLFWVFSEEAYIYVVNQNTEPPKYFFFCFLPGFFFPFLLQKSFIFSIEFSLKALAIANEWQRLVLFPSCFYFFICFFHLHSSALTPKQNSFCSFFCSVFSIMLHSSCAFFSVSLYPFNLHYDVNCMNIFISLVVYPELLSFKKEINK